MARIAIQESEEDIKRHFVLFCIIHIPPLLRAFHRGDSLAVTIKNLDMSLTTSTNTSVSTILSQLKCGEIQKQ